MRMREGFHPVHFVTGRAFMSLTSSGLGFNKISVLKMGSPKFIQFFINEEDKQLAIREASGDNEFAKRFVYDGMNIKNGVRYHNKDFEESIANMMGWDLTTKKYRIDGEFDRSDDTMYFDLTNFREFPRNKRAER